MICAFNYSDIITEEHQNKAKNLIDNLIISGNWDKLSPSFQTYPNLYQYSEFNIFFNCFLNSCNQYKNKLLEPTISKMWCYVDNGSNFFKTKSDKHENLWHSHQQDYTYEGISGVYYLKNNKKLSTEFKNFKIEYPKDYTWYIFPSDLEHRSPKITCIEKRYTLAADIFFMPN